MHQSQRKRVWRNKSFDVVKCSLSHYLYGSLWIYKMVYINIFNKKNLHLEHKYPVYNCKYQSVTHRHDIRHILCIMDFIYYYVGNCLELLL